MSVPAFSAAERHHAWSQLNREEFDLLVVGGGITGAGIARDAAGRTLRVCLLDAGDLGGGASSRSSRLVHGGLRYLESFELDLVFESLRERERLLEFAPHLVHPLSFLFPIFRGDPTGVAKLGIGVWLYETLALFRSPHHPRVLGRSGVLDREPGVRSRGLRGGALYWDAQVDDARLTLSVARSAFELGARLVSHARVVALAPARGAIGTAVVRDELSGAETTLRARVIVNATGAWSDRVRALSDPQSAPRLRPTRGVHLLVPRARVGNHHALIFRSCVDGRVMFVLPWGEWSYIGTTDTREASDPGAVHPDRSDVDYLLASANALFPRAELSMNDVVSSWAGVRPLLAPGGGERTSESAVSREHAIWRDPSGLLSIAGGKLTTYRSMAAELVHRAGEILDREFSISMGRNRTDSLPLPGAPERSLAELRLEIGNRCEELALGIGCGDHLVHRYGSLARQLLEMIEEDGDLGVRIVEDLPYLWAEVVYAVRHEMALTLDDVLRRRVPIFYERSDGGVAIAGQVARRIASEAGLRWGELEIATELASYAAAVRATRPEGWERSAG